MEATSVLIEEHRVIERVLNALEAGLNRLESGQPVSPTFFLSATDFMRGYADGCHHEKEEGILFKYMEEQGFPREGCPLGVMLAEHEVGRQYTRALLSAAKAMQAGEASANHRAVQSGRSYIALLRQHIIKEDSILFPMADNVIPAEQHARVSQSFLDAAMKESADGAYEKYFTLADALEQEITAVA